MYALNQFANWSVGLSVHVLRSFGGGSVQVWFLVYTKIYIELPYLVSLLLFLYLLSLLVGVCCYNIEGPKFSVLDPKWEGWFIFFPFSLSFNLFFGIFDADVTKIPTFHLSCSFHLAICICEYVYKGFLQVVFLLFCISNSLLKVLCALCMRARRDV